MFEWISRLFKDEESEDTKELEVTKAYYQAIAAKWLAAAALCLCLAAFAGLIALIISLF